MKRLFLTTGRCPLTTDPKLAHGRTGQFFASGQGAVFSGQSSVYSFISCSPALQIPKKLFENSDLPQRGRKMVARRKTSGPQAVSSGVLKGRQDSSRPFRTRILSACSQRRRLFATALPLATICLRLQRKEFGVFKQLLSNGSQISRELVFPDNKKVIFVGLDQAQMAKALHKRTDARSRRPHHLRQFLLRDL